VEVRKVGRYAAPQALGARVDQPLCVVLAPLRLGVVDALRGDIGNCQGLPG